MSERKSSMEELSRRIDELLNILSMISRDLAEVSKTLREITPPAPVSPARMQRIEEIRAAFPKDLEEMLTFEETEMYIVIRPRQYLGSENFAKIASIVRDVGGEYISAGKESHFRVPREMG